MVRFVFALLLSMTLAAPFTATAVHATPAPAPISAEAASVINLGNAQRAAAGLPLLTVHPVLMAEAQRFSAVQAQLGGLNHGGNDGTTPGQRLRAAGYKWRHYGENLAAGQQTPEEVVTDWMNSPSHRAIVLNTKVREIGIGLTLPNEDAAGYYSYWVMEVGRRR